MDDIILTGSGTGVLIETNVYLKLHFVTKDMEKLRYFFGIGVANHKNRLLLL